MGCFNQVSRLLCVYALLASAPACAPEPKSPLTQAEYAKNAAKAFKAAEAQYTEGNWEYARQLMDHVQRNYAYTDYARRAQLRIADIAVKMDRLPEAVAEYKAYIHAHANDAAVPQARIRLLRAQYAQADNNFFQPALEERDLGVVREVYSGVRAFIADYPGYPDREELRYLHESAGGLLARHELYVARFYLRQENFAAAVRRSQYVLRHFADSGMEPEAIVLLGEVFLQMKERRRARALFQHVVDQYPSSGFAVPARRFLAELYGSGA